MTTILVSHDINTVAHLCDRAVLIRQERVERHRDRVALGSLAEAAFDRSSPEFHVRSDTKSYV
ncbi:hypothetical protein [Pseudomonas caricapapayae]|nr:hypothetical protein [Pseudomonas caricapapayae]